MVAAVAFLSFVIGTWDQPFIDFETRFALFAKEMLRHGVSFFPTTYGQPYPDYPVTSTLLIYGLARLSGVFNKFVAVLPTAIATTGVVVLTFRLLVRSSPVWAIAAVCFEWMTFTFVKEGRSISLDQMVSLVTLTSFYVAYRSEQAVKPRLGWWLLPLCVLGFLIRGPIGVILPAAAAGSYYLVCGRFVRVLKLGVAAVVVMGSLWLLQLGIAWQQGGEDLVQAIVRMQVTERMNLEDYQPFHYYFTSSLGNFAPTFPIFVLVVLGLAAYRPTLGHPAERLLVLGLLAWVAVIMVGLSIPHTKKARYLLCIVPPLCAIASFPLATFAMPRLRRTLLAWLGILPGLLMAVLWYAKEQATPPLVDVVASLWPATAALTALQILAVSSFALRALPSRQVALLCGTAALASWLSWVMVAEPALIRLHDTSSFVVQAERSREQATAPLAFYRIGKDGMAIKYMVNLEADEFPRFPASEGDLRDLPRPIYVLMESATQQQLSREIAAQLRPVHGGRFDKTTLDLLYWPAEPGKDDRRR